MDAFQYNGLALAYIGDAIYELKVRCRLLEEGLTKVNDLHTKAVKYTKGEAQAKVMRNMIENNMLSEIELDMFKRGRNSGASTTRKHISRSDYQEGTGFESLIGYLYLEGLNERIDEIVDYSFLVLKEA
jgi:ribonuclease-3 family protein